MAREINRLSPREVATKKKPGRYADGGGLYLQVSRNGARSWLFRFMLRGKARQMGLGPLRTVSLAEARREAEGCRALVRKGVDPIEQRKAERARQATETATSMTFRQCADGYIRSHGEGWKNAKHLQQWQNTLSTYVYPVFGDVPVQDINTGMIMEVLEPIWTTKTETASRVRGRIESVLDWATARDYRKGENPARWRGHLKNLLPAPTRVRRVSHYPALPYDQLGAFMAELRKMDGTAARGLEFLILTAARTQEVTGAYWDEMDLTKKVWTVPAERMKARKEHRVPLSPEAVDVLKAMKEVRQSDHVFPGARDKRPLSNMAFLKVLERMKKDDLTAHGFRSTFRDWAAERTAYPREVAEMALAHVVSDKVEAAYRRGDLFDKRRRMMEDWAEFCGTVPEEGDNVVALNQR